MSIAHTAVQATTTTNANPGAVNTFIETMQANPFGALCFLLICMLIYMSYKEKYKNTRKEKKKKARIPTEAPRKQKAQP
jgi:hypothetical protein